MYTVDAFVTRALLRLVAAQSRSFQGRIDQLIATAASENRSPADLLEEALELADEEARAETRVWLAQEAAGAAGPAETGGDLGDIVDLDDRSVQRILREVDAMELARALRGVSDEVRDKVFRNMSARAVRLLKEDVDAVAAIAEEECLKARRGIQRIIRNLDRAGEIHLPRAGRI